MLTGCFLCSLRVKRHISLLQPRINDRVTPSGCRGGAASLDVKATTRLSPWGSFFTVYRPETRSAAGHGWRRFRTPGSTKTPRCPNTAESECAACTSPPRTTRRTFGLKYSTLRPNRCWRAVRCLQCSPGDRAVSPAAKTHQLRPQRDGEPR